MHGQNSPKSEIIPVIALFGLMLCAVNSKSYKTDHGSFLINMDSSKMQFEMTIGSDSGDINDLERKRSHRRRRVIRKPSKGRNPK